MGLHPPRPPLEPPLLIITYEIGIIYLDNLTIRYVYFYSIKKTHRIIGKHVPNQNSVKYPSVIKIQCTTVSVNDVRLGHGGPFYNCAFLNVSRTIGKYDLCEK